MSQPIRVAYVTDGMADVRMIEGLALQSDLTVVAPHSLGDRVTNYWPPRAPAQATKVTLPGGRLGFVLRSAWWLRSHRGEVDVAVALDNLTAALGVTIAHLFGGPPVVLQIGRPTLDYLRCQPRGPKWAVRYVAAWLMIQMTERQAAAIGAVSDYCATQCRARNHTVASIPWYGVDTEHFRPGDKAEARRRLGLDPDSTIVMLRSRIAPEKDAATFLRAVARLRAGGRQLVALYMGGEIAEMEREAAALGVEVVCRKPSDVSEIPLWYVAADVDVQASRAEGLGVSPLEALACEVPVVVSDAGGLSQVVDGGRVGALVPIGDDEAMAKAIGRYLDDPKLARQHGRLGRRWVDDRFTVDAAFEAWRRLIAGAVGRSDNENGVPRRVLFVDHETRLSGGQRDLVDLVRALDRTRFEVHVALPGPGPLADALASHGALVHHVDMGGGLRRVSRWDLARRPTTIPSHLGAAVQASRAIKSLAVQLRPDLVHTNSMKSHLLAIPAARSLRVPLVWHIRDILQAGWLRRAMSTAAWLFATRIVSLSRVAAEPFEIGGLAARVRVVHNGVRPQEVQPGAPADWRIDVGADDNDVLVVLVGQIARWKGQDVLVEAAALGQLPDVRYAVVGECLFPENEGDFDRALRDRVAQLGLEDRFVFAGAVSPIEPVMAAADIVVHCSRLPEPFGRVIVEAMAQSRPVISTTIGAGPELVPDEAGILIPPDDPRALAAAIARLAESPETRIEMGRAGREVAAGFDIAATAAGVVAVWDELT